MDFTELKGLPLGDAVHAMINEGGAVTGGLLAGGFVGRQVENMVLSVPVTPTSSGIDKIKGWAANNIPKLLVWYALRGKGGAMEDVKKGVVTSAAFDTLMRLLNSGVNPATATVYGYQVLGEGYGNSDTGAVQRLVQENSVLRSELSKRSVQVQQTPMDPRLPPYVGGASGAIPPAERERKFAFMQPAIPGKAGLPPQAESRQVRYGFAGETAVMSGAGRPGAAYVQAGKMFSMQ